MEADKKVCKQCAKAVATRSMRVTQPSETLYFCEPCYRMNIDDRDYQRGSEAQDARKKAKYER